MEEWRVIDKFPDYEVSNYGRVRSYKRIRGLEIPHIMIPKLNRLGYQYLTLVDSNNRKRSATVHRLVALAFIPNSSNLPCVNHKDENKTNNRINNLEWCTQEYNINYGSANLRRSNSNTNNPAYSKCIYQFNFDGQLINSYASGAEAARQTGLTISTISKAAIHESKYAGSWLWSYDKDYSFRNEIEYIGRIHYLKNSQPINQYDKEGNFITSFIGFNQVEQFLNNPKFNMSNILQSMKRKGSCYGYYWKFGHPTFAEHLAQINNN